MQRKPRRPDKLLFLCWLCETGWFKQMKCLKKRIPSPTGRRRLSRWVDSVTFDCIFPWSICHSVPYTCWFRGDKDKTPSPSFIPHATHPPPKEQLFPFIISFSLVVGSAWHKPLQNIQGSLRGLPETRSLLFAPCLSQGDPVTSVFSGKIIQAFTPQLLVSVFQRSVVLAGFRPSP